MTSNLVIVGVQNRDVSENIYYFWCKYSLTVVGSILTDLMWLGEIDVLMWHNKSLMYKMGNGSQDAALWPQTWPRQGKTNCEKKKIYFTCILFVSLFSVHCIGETLLNGEFGKKTRGKQFSTSLTQSEKKTLKDSWIEDPSSVRVNHSRHPSPINPLHLLKLDAWW